jgi:hypothetical protein
MSGVQVHLQGVFSASKRQAGGGIGGHLGVSTQLLHEEDKSHLQIAPWLWGVFQEKTKQHPFVLFGQSNLFEKIMKLTRGFPDI